MVSKCFTQYIKVFRSRIAYPHPVAHRKFSSVLSRPCFALSTGPRLGSRTVFQSAFRAQKSTFFPTKAAIRSASSLDNKKSPLLNVHSQGTTANNTTSHRKANQCSELNKKTDHPKTDPLTSEVKQSSDKRRPYSSGNSNSCNSNTTDSFEVSSSASCHPFISPVTVRRIGLIILGSFAGYVVGWQMRSTRKSDSTPHTTPEPSALETQPAAEASQELFLTEMTDTIFDSKDHLCVFWVASVEELKKRRPVIERFINSIKSFDLPFPVTFSYSIRPSDDATPSTETPPDRTGVPVILYMGQRKTSLMAWESDEVEEAMEKSLSLPLPQKELLKQFFRPVSEEDDDEEATEDCDNSTSESLVVPFVTYKTFKKDVIEASSSNSPILVQLMEDSCFLCFLMRPFINTIARILEDHHCSLKIKRLNLDKNDFPSGCPVVRSTPNFVLYRGQTDETPKPWKEYKPKEFVEKLVQEFNIPNDARAASEEAVEKLQERFQKFGLLSIWTQELSALQKLYDEGLAAFLEDKTDVEKQFSSIVNDLVKQDVRRNDGLDDNLQYLDQAIASIEADCVTFAQMIGKETLERCASESSRQFELTRARLAYGDKPVVPEVKGDTEAAESPGAKVEDDQSATE